MTNAAVTAMEESEANMNKRRKLSNYDLIARYSKRKESVTRKIDRAILKVVRASLYLSRVRAEKLYLERVQTEAVAAVERGEAYPKPKAKKQKRGRHIEL